MAENFTQDQIEMIKVLSSRQDLTPDQQQMVSVLMSRIAEPEEAAKPTGEPMPIEVSGAELKQAPAARPAPKPWAQRADQPLTEEPFKEIGRYALGAGETALKGVSELGGMVASGLTGLASLAFGRGEEKTEETMGRVGEALTYQPKTEAGQTVSQFQERALSAPFEKPMEAYGKLSELAAEKTGEVAGPTAAGIVGSTMATLPAAVGYGLAGRQAMKSIANAMKGKQGPAAKIRALKETVQKTDRADFYDEFGDLKPEIKTRLKTEGIALDEVSDVLPETLVTQKAATPIAERIKKKQLSQTAKAFEPDIEKIKAFEEMELDYLPQYVANNPTSAAIAENLKDIPGSLMAATEKKVVRELSKRADDVIKEAGGTIEKGELAARYVEKSKAIVDSLANESDKLYDQVAKRIPKNTPVEPNRIISLLREKADDVGGEKYLTAKERGLLKQLAPETNPTYARLDIQRKQIGRQLGGQDTPFRDVDRTTLGELYDALTKDQESIIMNYGDKDLLGSYLSGKHMVAQRKAIEKQLQDVLGKKIEGDITKKMGNAVKQLATGDYRTFDSLLDKIPKDLGQEMRTELVATALNDAFLAGARSKDAISIGGFSNYWKRLNRNPKAMNRLATELGPKAWKRVQTLAKVNDSLKTAMDLSVKTGRQLSTPGLFDEVNKIAARAYGVVPKIGAKIPGISSMFEDIVNQPKNARSVAADELLSDRKFQRILRHEAAKKIKTPNQVDAANRAIEGLKSYQRWKKAIARQDLNKVAADGALAFFTTEMGE